MPIPPCPAVRNQRGRTPQAPCDDYCGPFDVGAWYDTAQEQLDTAQAWHAYMTTAQRVELARLWERWENLPPRATAAPWDEGARRAALLAQDARCLSWVVAHRGIQPPAPTPGPQPPPPTPPTDPEEPGEPWKLPTLPDLPDFPSFDLPDLEKYLPWLIGGAVFLLLWKDDGRRRR